RPCRSRRCARHDVSADVFNRNLHYCLFLVVFHMKYCSLRVFALTLAAVSVLSCAGSASAGVVIDEVMYHPASENLLESYVELHNLDTVSTNISGWRFTKGISFTFPTNTTLGPGAFLVVAADRAAFTNKYPSVANFVAGWSGTIGHHLKLEDAAGNTISDLQFADDGDWSTRILTTNGLASYGHYSWEWLAPQDGGGSSLELINSALL